MRLLGLLLLTAVLGFLVGRLTAPEVGGLRGPPRVPAPVGTKPRELPPAPSAPAERAPEMRAVTEGVVQPTGPIEVSEDGPATLSRVAREYSKHQQSLIRRFYSNRGAIDTQRLQEIVTEIYLAGKSKKADRLWQTAGEILLRTAGDDRTEADRIIADRDVEALARVAGARFGG